jgi:PAS domain S-box-containing protein
MTLSRPPAGGLSIRQRLTLIVLAVALPLLALSAAIVWRLDQRERQTRRDAMMYASRSILSGVDAQLDKFVATAKMIAANSSLQRDDLTDFRQQSERALSELSGAWVSLADTHGQELINTFIAAREPLPRVTAAQMADEGRAFETEQILISNETTEGDSKVPAVTVEVPIFHSGKPAYFLTIGIDATVFLDLLNSQSLPEGWLAGVIDRRGNFIARSLDHKNWVGRQAPEGWRSIMNQEGWFEVPSPKGDLFTVANAVSPLSGWAVGVAAESDQLEAPIRQTTLVASLAGLAVTLLSVLLATWAAQKIIEPIKALQTQAKALQRKEPISFFPTRVPEIDDAMRAFDMASKTIIDDEKKLRNSEERRRVVVETANEAILVIDEGGIVHSFNPAAERIFGYRASEIIGRNVAILMPEPHRSAHDDYIDAYRRTGQAKIIGVGREVEAVRKDGRKFPVDLSVAEWRIEGERFFTGILRDITKRKQAEEHIQFIMRELSHRTKNMLAVVQAMAWKTARTSSNLDDFKERFTNRIEALARSHDLLSKGDWHGVSLEDLVRGQLLPFEAENHLDIHGPDLVLRPEAAQSLGLALHELATNASKYGALASPVGRIEVGWSIDPEDTASRQFRICWRESGGPEVAPPQRYGFGYTVLKEMTGRTLNGEVALEFTKEGFVWQLTAPAIACVTNPMK